MGLVSWLVLRQQRRLRAALPVYGVQLFFNFFWPLLFFRWGLFLPALFSWRRCGD
nr:tryptophan-rich sensory protein [uncultured Dysosmobacter sp.]